MFERAFNGIGVGEGRLARFLVAGMALGFLALVVAGAAAAWSTARNEDHTVWVNHTYQVEIAINEASLLVEQGETTRRGYLLTGQPSYLDAYADAAARLPAALQRVATLTRDNPRQQRDIARLKRLTDAVGAQRDQTIALMRSGAADAAIRAFRAETGAQRMRGIRTLAAAMGAEERRLLAARDIDQQASVRFFYATLALAGVLLVLVAGVSLATVLRYTRALTASRDVLSKFNDTLEQQVNDRTADLLRANDEIQRFAYIVSHDLRSPLVNVMGFTAELEDAAVEVSALIDRAEQDAPAIVTAQARIAAREDLPEAIRFIRSSTQKMDRLINAILKLAREGRRVLAPEAVDLAALLDTIAGSLAQQIAARGAVFAVEPPMPTLVTDRLALEQILSNLVENAVKYLDPKRAGRIVVRGRQDGARVVIEVADNGRGIAAADHSRVFDLFRRSGNQDQPGEGIGLAHVRALAYRLGGVIDVASELGQGATFRLILPRILIEAAREGMNT